MRRNAPLSLITLLVLITPVQAQQNTYVGRWRCEMTNYSTRNLAADNMTMRWVIQLNADGTYEASGSFFAQVIGYEEPLESTGRWSRTDQGIRVQGTWHRETIGQTPFAFEAKSSGRSLIWNGQGEAGRYALKCDPVGESSSDGQMR